mmetsp:Transcript_5644/g.11789  ORF Transcript_5644/g.11789 Transcript_5644/m.11789 type:complete len:235 (-) Transcript_5644:331-1035(-)
MVIRELIHDLLLVLLPHLLPGHTLRVPLAIGPPRPVPIITHGKDTPWDHGPLPRVLLRSIPSLVGQGCQLLLRHDAQVLQGHQGPGQEGVVQPPRGLRIKVPPELVAVGSERVAQGGNVRVLRGPLPLAPLVLSGVQRHPRHRRGGDRGGGGAGLAGRLPAPPSPPEPSPRPALLADRFLGVSPPQAAAGSKVQSGGRRRGGAVPPLEPPLGRRDGGRSGGEAGRGGGEGPGGH